MSRDPEQIQREIESSRAQLASTLDQLTERVSPKRVAGQGKAAALRFLQSPPGIAIVAGIGLLITVGTVRKARHRKGSSGRR